MNDVPDEDSDAEFQSSGAGRSRSSLQKGIFSCAVLSLLLILLLFVNNASTVADAGFVHHMNIVAGLALCVLAGLGWWFVKLLKNAR